MLRDDFAKHVSKVLAGTGGAQLITIAASPIITRLYGPENYGVFSVIIGVCTFASVFATGRYDTAIVVCPPQRTALAVAKLGVFLCLAFSVLGTAIVAVCHFLDAVPDALKPSGIWLFTIPASAALIGFSQILQSWTVRSKNFGPLSISRVGGSIVSTVVIIVLGSVAPNVGGLVVGSMCIAFSIAAILAAKVAVEDQNVFMGLSAHECICAGRRYIKFPLYSMPSDAANIAAQQMPLFLMMHYFDAKAVGILALTNRMMAIPVTLMSSSVLDVFKQRAASDFSTSGSCRRVFVRTFWVLVAMGVLPMILVVATGPDLFRVAFGSEWSEAGVYARILAPLFLLRFVVSPLSYVLYIAEKQHLDLLGNVLLLLAAYVSISVGGSNDSAMLGLNLYVLAYGAIYAGYIVLCFKLSNQRGAA